MTEINSDLMEQVIHNATFSADSAVMDAHQAGDIAVPADTTRVAVRAAIRNAVGNGALQLTPEVDQVEWWRLGDPDTWDDKDSDG